MRDIVANAPGLIHPGGSVWLELDSSHPQMLARRYPPFAQAVAQGAPQAATQGALPDAATGPGIGQVEGHVEVVQWWRDLSGHPRFVRIRTHGA